MSRLMHSAVRSALAKLSRASFSVSTKVLQEHSSTVLPAYSSLLKPRLEDHYYTTLLEDMMVLNYDHDSPMASLEALEKSKEWNRSLSQNELEELFSMPLEKLPTKPFSNDTPVTHLLTLENSTKGDKLQSRKKRRLPNPIDYTIVRKEDWNKDVGPVQAEPYAPLPSRLPMLKKVVLKIWAEEAVKSKSFILPAVMILQSITGVHAQPLFADFGDSNKGIREGMPMGAVVEIKGQRMFDFLDKMTQCVLPRLREWNGFEAIGDNQGQLALKLPKQAVGYFPDIEPHFDSFPRLFDVDVLVQTTGQSDWETALLLSGLQIPIQPKRIIKVTEEKKRDDPWAQFRKPKTKEERRALAKKATSDAPGGDKQVNPA